MDDAALVQMLDGQGNLPQPIDVADGIRCSPGGAKTKR